MAGETPEAALAELRQAMAAAGLEPDAQDDISGCLTQIEQQLGRAKPNQTLIRNNLANVAALLAEQTQAVRVPLQQRLDTLQRLLLLADANATAPSVPAAGHPSSTAQSRAVIIGGKAQYVTIVTGDGNTLSVPAGQLEPAVLLQGYYRLLAQDCRRLPLGVVDPRFAQPSPEGEVSLDEVYTDLDVVTVPRQEDEGDSRWGWRLARGESGQRTPLLAAISEAPLDRLALVGDAGSGKTTFVNYLTYCLAAAGANDASPPLPAVLQGRLPVRLIDSASGGVLWEALQADIAERLGTAAAERLFPHLQQRLLQEPSLVLLDGLDEVPEAANRRQCLLTSLRALSKGLPQARILLTARPYAHADPRWQLPGFQLLALAPFNKDQVERFVDRWHQAVRPAMSWDAVTADGRARHLAQALFQRPYLADLASRPLLLTLMATLDSSWGQLPDDRAELYEESVKLLLSRWQKGREARGPDGQPLQEPGIARALSLGEGVIRSALEKLAFTTHQRQGQGQERVEAPADIPYGDVLAVFTPLLPEDVSPDVLLRYLENRAGLLIGRREGVYAFPHRSFQEYLAACHLANTEGDFAARLRALVWEDLAWWREVFLLGVGKKRQGGLGDAINVINTLTPCSPDELEERTAIDGQAAALAGEALLELRAPEETASQLHYQALRKRLQKWLRRQVETGQGVPRERLVAGDVLGRLGDPRPGVGVLTLPESGLIMPDIDWIEIPAGPFTMGSREDDDQADEAEKPAHPIDLPAFRISRYPITNAQYQPFVAAGGYDDPQWWTAEGWAWRQGAAADLSAIDDADLRKQYLEWLAQRPAEKRNRRPFWWDDPPGMP